jgi:glycosyltransferase involved in cell wall biosynthesis
MADRSLNDVTVVIAVFNGEAHIRAALTSVLSQVGSGNAQIIVVNDGSTDNTADVLAEFSSQITILETDNCGQASALNLAVERVVTDFVAYLDADDVAEPERLCRQLRVFAENPAVGMVYTDRYIINGGGDRTAHSHCKNFDMISIYQFNPITRSSVMHRTELLRSLGGFDVTISGNDDWDMWIRMAENCLVHHLAIPLVNYRIHSENLSVKRMGAALHNRRCRVHMLEKCARRRSGVWYIKFMLVRARLNLWLFNGPFSEGNFWFWNRFDRFQELVEYLIIVTAIRLGSFIRGKA